MAPYSMDLRKRVAKAWDMGFTLKKKRYTPTNNVATPSLTTFHGQVDVLAGKRHWRLEHRLCNAPANLTVWHDSDTY